MNPNPSPFPIPYPNDHPTLIPFTEPWQYELRFPCDPRGPGIARIALRAVLRGHGLTELTDRAELLTSELATNSVRHTKGPASVHLHWVHPVLRISVWDPCPDFPLPLVGPCAEADSGRGLLLVDAVADRWGGGALSDGPFGPRGKTVWFELAVDSSPPSLCIP